MSAAKKPAKKPEAEKADEKPAKKGGDLTGRLGAWWNGVDYTPPSGEVAEGEKTAKAEKSAKEKPAKKEPKAEEPIAPTAEAAAAEVVEAAKAEAAAKPVSLVVEAAAHGVKSDAMSVRVKALETLWGEGRLAPGSADIDAKLLDAALEQADGLGEVGFLAADGALLKSFAARSEREAVVAEWRDGYIARMQELAPKARIERCDLDRPRALGEGKLEALVSLEAFAFADHKNGLVLRAHRALGRNGRWVILETTRNTSRTPAEAFASAWAEPQLATADDVEEVLKLTGFASVQKIPMNDLVLDAARMGYQRLASELETAAKSGMAGREGALFLQELAWEAQSWRARVRALEGGALEVNLWIADKLAPLELTQEAVSDELLETAVKPDDAGASDQLFEDVTDAPSSKVFMPPAPRV
ncbi:MAG TPA: hypothetical protein VGO52_22115 [Hyphomonadaceae bacterium]|jgi:hypothetical protein|nr:hypothetical protein [Hyphomonadaceae bacterium]